MKNILRDDLRRLGALLLSSLLLAGCASPAIGPYVAVTAPIPEGMGRLIIYRTSIVGACCDVDIAINDVLVCHVPPQAVFVREVPVGKIKVSADFSTGPGMSVLNVDLRNQEEKFLKVAPNASRIGRAFIPVYGLFGQYIEANNETPRGGAYGIDELSATEARQDIKGFDRAGCAMPPMPTASSEGSGG